MPKKSYNFLIEPAKWSAFVQPEIQIKLAEGKAALEAKALKNKVQYKGTDRPQSDVTGVVLHQMGFSRGPAVEKYFPVTAHFIITSDGSIAQLHTVIKTLYASNHLNNFTMAVEFAGNLQNDRGQWWSGGTSQNKLTPEQVASGRFLMDVLKAAYHIRRVYAHRQGTGPRKANCCGPEIWFNVAEYAIMQLGYEDTRDETYGNGSPIPTKWRST